MIGRRVAAIDIGTNTALMLIAELDAARDIFAVEDHARITRLGRGVDRSGVLDDAAVAATLDVLRGYRARADELGVEAIAAVATSASRDAKNGGAFRQAAQAILGGVVEVIDGGAEAKLTFLGALGGLGLAPGSRVGVIDVGGGSTEIVIGEVPSDHRASSEPSIAWSHSYDVGSVRLTERHLRSDPPSSGELAAIGDDLSRTLGSPPVPTQPLQSVVAIAGTATSYAAVDLGLVRYADAPPHGHRMRLDRLHELVQSLASKPLDLRRATIGLEPQRADVIVAGGLTILAAARALGAREIVVSDRGVRWGLARRLAGALPPR